MGLITSASEAQENESPGAYLAPFCAILFYLFQTQILLLHMFIVGQLETSLQQRGRADPCWSHLAC